MPPPLLPPPPLSPGPPRRRACPSLVGAGVGPSRQQRGPQPVCSAAAAQPQAACRHHHHHHHHGCGHGHVRSGGGGWTWCVTWLICLRLWGCLLPFFAAPLPSSQQQQLPLLLLFLLSVHAQLVSLGPCDVPWLAQLLLPPLVVVVQRFGWCDLVAFAAFGLHGHPLLSHVLQLVLPPYPHLVHPPPLLLPHSRSLEAKLAGQRRTKGS